MRSSAEFICRIRGAWTGRKSRLPGYPPNLHRGFGCEYGCWGLGAPLARTRSSPNSAACRLKMLNGQRFGEHPGPLPTTPVQTLWRSQAAASPTQSWRWSSQVVSVPRQRCAEHDGPAGEAYPLRACLSGMLAPSARALPDRLCQLTLRPLDAIGLHEPGV